MPVESGMILSGQKEFRKLMKDLPETIHRKASKKAISKAGTAMKQAVIQEIDAMAFDDSIGAMRKSIKKVTRTYPNSMAIVSIVGPDKNFTMPDDNKFGLRRPANYLHLLIDGHFGPGGVWVQPFDFMRPAFRKVSPKALNIYASDLRGGIKKAANLHRGRNLTGAARRGFLKRFGGLGGLANRRLGL